jgi:amino-acid N-acetyltransferase
LLDGLPAQRLHKGREAVQDCMNAVAPVIHPRPELAVARAFLQREKLPASDLTDEHLKQFFFAGPVSAPIGLVGLELYGSVALLRSLVVSSDARSSGMGTALVTYCEDHARSLGVRSLYLLTTTAESFFARRGYCRIDRVVAPPAIRSTNEFANLCPASSAFMFKQL